MSVQELSKAGEPYKVDTVEEPCYSCGVVQEMEVWEQRYDNHPKSVFTKGECPVCGNDHEKNGPW